MKKGIREFLYEEDGIGTVEMILILVVLIALVAIFKSELTDIVENLFEGIKKSAKKI